MANHRIALIGAMALACVLTLAAPTNAVNTSDVTFSEFTIDKDAMCDIRDEWIEDILATHEPGTWAEMRVELTDSMLAKMGLPPRDILLGMRFPVPTMVAPDGRTMEVELPSPVEAQMDGHELFTPTSYAGSGCFGLRPGALLLIITDDSIGWCSMAHAYGSPGNYDLSTAGHCGKGGTPATAIAALGNHEEFGLPVPVLLDFGQLSGSRDGGLGADYARISVDNQWQHLVSPTMCFWGGPWGQYEDKGHIVDFEFPRRGLVPEVTLDPNPFLAQTITHYGHGTGVGTGGTPRTGEAIAWGDSHFMFFGAISPGDSGSGSNVITGDGIATLNQAAGINTHLYVDPLMREGLGIMGGTRVTKLGTVADGQLLPYPIQAPLLP